MQKLYLLKPFQEWEEEHKGEWGRSEVIYLIHCRDLCKFHNLPPPTTTIKKKRNGQADLIFY
jgi:hypothetical protein